MDSKTRTLNSVRNSKTPLFLVFLEELSDARTKRQQGTNGSNKEKNFMRYFLRLFFRTNEVLQEYFEISQKYEEFNGWCIE